MCVSVECFRYVWTFRQVIWDQLQCDKLCLNFFVLGLDIPKHGEPAYPLASYGDGWSESPSAPRQTLPFSHSNGVTPVQSNYPEKGGGIDNPSLEVIEAPNKNETTEFWI